MTPGAGRLVVLALLALGTALPALEVKGTPFPARQTIGATTLQATGGARLSWKWVFTIYDAAFYLDAAAPAGTDPLSDVAKRYEIVYRRTFTAAECVEATDKTIGRGLPASERLAAAADIAALNQAYVAVKDGDRFAYTYIPGTGTTMSLNGQDLVTIPGPQLARVLFAIWVGPDPVDRDFAGELLGRK
jgi:hypothetical protein